MKFKVMTILFLISAIVVASLFGTLSSYTMTSKYEIGIVADVQATPEPTAEPTVKPTEQPTAEPTVEPTEQPTAEPTLEPTITPIVNPVPDESNIGGDYIVNGMNVKNNTVLENDKAFVMIMGTIKQKQNCSLSFGSKQQSEVYLLYFKPKTKIKFSDGTIAKPSGFYTIAAGQNGVNLFDETLYELDGDVRVVKENNGDFTTCTDQQAILLCEQMNIPLI